MSRCKAHAIRACLLVIAIALFSLAYAVSASRQQHAPEIEEVVQLPSRIAKPIPISDSNLNGELESDSPKDPDAYRHYGYSPGVNKFVDMPVLPSGAYFSADGFDREWMNIPFTGYNASREPPHVLMMLFGQDQPEIKSREIAKTAIIEWISEIKSTIEPDSWDSTGGKGWISMWPKENDDLSSGRRSSGVLVFNTPRVRARIRRYIANRVTAEQARYIEELRELYPYDSLAKRLAYERPRATRAGRRKPSPLSKEVARQLDAHEGQFGAHWQNRKRYDDRRSRSLALLHSGRVAEFIANSGFGVTRTPPLGPAYLEIPQRQDIPFAETSHHFADIVEASFTTTPDIRRTRDWGLPAQNSLADFHIGAYDNFLDHRGFGHIIDQTHVAGFAPHAFSRLPEYPDWQVKAEQIPKERWLVTRLELISLLKFDRPAVYVSANLPRMDKLADSNTRSLNLFERESVSRLRSGEELAVRYSVNHIQMVGALRAIKQCIDCHQVARGELLGAFSYDLCRDPPRGMRELY